MNEQGRALLDQYEGIMGKVREAIFVFGLQTTETEALEAILKRNGTSGETFAESADAWIAAMRKKSADK